MRPVPGAEPSIIDDSVARVDRRLTLERGIERPSLLARLLGKVPDDICGPEGRYHEDRPPPPPIGGRPSVASGDRAIA